MQAILEFIQHIAVAILILVHAAFFSFIPLHKPTQESPSSGAPLTAKDFPASAPARPAGGSATSSVKAKLFPVAGSVKPSQASTTNSTPKQNPVAPPQAASEGSAQAKPPVVLLPQSIVNDVARAAAVNIFCVTKAGGSLHPISGSGVMITKNGVILTNAHVAQYFLLKDYLVADNIDCRIRTGSPAQNTYKAELLYLPPAWINANANQIAAEEGLGTGENDYAFLRVTSSTDPSKSLPATFPALTMTTDDPSHDEAVLLASYPAGFLDGITIEMSLYVSTVLTKITDIFAFNDQGAADLFSLGGSVVAQAGSSGGAVVRQQDASLQGIIATETQTTDSKSTDAHDLHAITLGHINRSLQAAGIGGIAQLLSGDISAKASDFAKNTAPGELKKLVDALNKH